MGCESSFWSDDLFNERYFCSAINSETRTLWTQHVYLGHAYVLRIDERRDDDTKSGTSIISIGHRPARASIAVGPAWGFLGKFGSLRKWRQREEGAGNCR